MHVKVLSTEIGRSAILLLTLVQRLGGGQSQPIEQITNVHAYFWIVFMWG